MAEKIKASFRASEEQKTEWVHIDMVAANYNWKMIYGEKNLDVFSRETFIVFLLIIDIVLSSLHFVWLRPSINQGMETWNAFDQINSFRYSFSSVQDQTQIHVMDWILGWPFVKVVPAILASPKYLLTPFPLPPLQYGHFGALFPPETNLASAFTFWK